MEMIDKLGMKIKESQIRGENVTKSLEELCTTFNKLDENTKISEEKLQSIDYYITEIENTLKAQKEFTNSIKNIELNL
jgi:molecular chaperone DnaK (HSP70)